MLAPKRVKFRKWQKGRLRGPALRGATIAFGDIGLKTVEHGKLTNQQIEAARIAMMRHIKRGGKVIRVFPDHPVTAKPRNPSGFRAYTPVVGTPVKPGRTAENQGVSLLSWPKEALTQRPTSRRVKTVW